MATQIPIGTTAYFTDFAGGQGGGAASYFSYAPDLDTNFLLLRQTVNQLIVEVNAVSGPNATIALDLTQYDDPNGSRPQATAGLIGARSYLPTRQNSDTELLVEVGKALVGSGQKAESTTQVVLAGAPLSDGTAYLAIDANGIPSISNTPNNQSLDLYTVPVASGVYTADPTLVAEVFLDGDFLADLRTRPQAGTTFPARVFDNAVERIREIELLLSGGTPDPGPNIALPPGTVSNPGLIFSDGVGGEDDTTGWYRSAADAWSWSGAGTERLRLTSAGQVRIVALGSSGAPALVGGGTNAVGIYFPDANTLAIVAATSEVVRFQGGQIRSVDGAVGAPAYTFETDPDTGMYRAAANDLVLVAGGVSQLRLLGAQLRAPNGAVGAPAHTFDADPDTGVYRIAADRLGLATAGTLGLEVTAAQQLTAPGVFRVKANGTTSVPTGAYTALTFGTEDYDVGAMHDTVTNSDQFVVPTGGAGLWLITAGCFFPNTTTEDRRFRLTRNGTPIPGAEWRNWAASATTDPIGSVIPWEMELSDADVIRLEAIHDNGANLTVTHYLTMRRVAA